MKTTLLKTRVKAFLSLGIATWILFSSSTSFAGTVLNGSFENGLTNWTSTGLASVKTTYGGVAPPDLNNQALISSSDTPSGDETVANLALALSIPQSQITALGTDTVTRGSGLSQVVTGVKDGDILTFSWKYLTSEAAGNTNNDFGFFSVSRAGGTQTAILLADTNSSTTPFSSPESTFSRQTVYGTTSYTFTDVGTFDYTIGFGIVNVSDTSFPSGLLLDKVSAVPEPTALAGLGLVGLALSLRRRRR